jgi:cytoskeletal protein CcmA (bactofilin family)
MLNLGRNDRWVDVKEPNKPGAKPAVTPAAPQPGSVISGAMPTPRPAPQPVTPAPAPAAAAPAPAATEPSPSPREVAPQPSPEEVAGSKLFVGVNIKLKGVEISNSDVLVIEGQVDATINSKVMEISKPGTLTGTAVIDVAEIHGEFSGELTARKKLVVHGTGRVTGNVRYGKLVVAEGGTVTGEVRQIDQAADARPSTEPRNGAD